MIYFFQTFHVKQGLALKYRHDVVLMFISCILITEHTVRRENNTMINNTRINSCLLRTQNCKSNFAQPRK